MCHYGMQGDLNQGLRRMLKYFHPGLALINDMPMGKHCLFSPSHWFPYMEMKSPVPFFSGILWLYLRFQRPPQRPAHASITLATRRVTREGWLAYWVSLLLTGGALIKMGTCVFLSVSIWKLISGYVLRHCWNSVKN